MANCMPRISFMLIRINGESPSNWVTSLPAQTQRRDPATLTRTSFFSCRSPCWPVPSQTESRSLQLWLRAWSNPKCCGSWAQCWLWFSLSSLSSPSCYLRSKTPVLIQALCVHLNCCGRCDSRFPLIASVMKTSLAS